MYWYIKLFLDKIFALIGFLISLPFCFLIGLGIKLSSPGKILYIANRVGINKTSFNLFKFRTMDNNINSATRNNFIADTNRIYPFGKFLRDYKLDELPQFINILKGDISLIGPRPIVEAQVDLTWPDLQNTNVKSGLSCPAALYEYLYGRKYTTNEEEYIKNILPARYLLDKWYIRNVSLKTDFIICIFTILSIFNLFTESILSYLNTLINNELEYEKTKYNNTNSSR